MNNDDALMGLGILLLGIGVLVFAFGFVAIVWFVLSAIIGYIQYQKYLKEADEEFEAIARETGVDLPVDDILQSIGIEVPDAPGFETVADWMAGTPLGVSGL
jgi:hypothetical protein